MNEYKQAIKEEMEKLAKMPNTIFIGQQVGAEDFYGTLTDIPYCKRMEMPVAEELQMGMSIGMALEGLLPISIYQRMDFLPRAADQLVNHLNILKKVSKGRFNPRMLIRTTIGSTTPMDVGPQHNKDLTTAMQQLLENVVVVKVRTPEEVHNAYKGFMRDNNPWMIIEEQDNY